MREYQGAAGSAPELNSPWPGDGQVNKKRQILNPSCPGIGQQLFQVGSYDPATLFWRQGWLEWCGHKSFCMWDNAHFLQSWTVPAIWWNRCRRCETVSVDLRAKAYLIWMHHGCTITSTLTLSLIDRHNRQWCFQLLVFYWTIIILHSLKPTDLLDLHSRTRNVTYDTVAKY